MQINTNTAANPFADLSALTPDFKVPTWAPPVDPALSKTKAGAASEAADFVSSNPVGVTNLATAVVGEPDVNNLSSLNRPMSS